VGFFDFLGSGPGQLSSTELLSAIPMIAGDVLQARHGKIGGPLGVGLGDIGQIGQALAQRKQKQAQNLALFNAMQKIDSRFSEVAPIVQAGGTIEDALAAFKLKYPTTKSESSFPIFNQKTGTEQIFDPSKGGTLPPGFVSSSFYKPQKPDKPTKETPFDLWQKQNPNATIADWEKLTHPTTNVNVETPLSPADITNLPGGKTGVYMRGKSGGITPTEIPGAKLPTKGAGKAPGLPKTFIMTTGGYVYKLAKKPDGTLVYKLSNPSSNPFGGGMPDELPGPAALPPGVATYSRPDGSVGFATRTP
jgi:hypothetical protein